MSAQGAAKAVMKSVWFEVSCDWASAHLDFGLKLLAKSQEGDVEVSETIV
jgi:hypothetical protein